MSTVSARRGRNQGQQEKKRTFVTRFLIEGIEYAVTPLRDLSPLVAAKAYRFRRVDASAKPSADTPSDYVVHLTPEGDARCECKGYLRWGHCKHVRTLKAFGCLDLPSDPIPASSVGDRDNNEPDHEGSEAEALDGP